MKRSTRWLLGIIGLLILAFYFLAPVCPCEDWDFYEEEGELLHASVLASWAEEGELPENIKAVKRRISAPVSSSWEYSASQDPPWYWLSIGSYNICGCDLYGHFRSKWDLNLQTDELPLKAQALALMQAAAGCKAESGRFPASAADFAMPVPEGWTYTPPREAPDWYMPTIMMQEGKLEYHGQEGSLALIFQVFEWNYNT